MVPCRPPKFATSRDACLVGGCDLVAEESLACVDDGSRRSALQNFSTGHAEANQVVEAPGVERGSHNAPATKLPAIVVRELPVRAHARVGCVALDAVQCRDLIGQQRDLFARDRDFDTVLRLVCPCAVLRLDGDDLCVELRSMDIGA